MTTESAFVLIEDAANLTVSVGRKISGSVLFSSRGANVERVELLVSFQPAVFGPPSIVSARDLAMSWIRRQNDKSAEQKREVGSRTP